VNTDSRQLYRYLDIGTGKPSLGERSNVPHHLIDILNPDEDFSLSLYLQLAQEALCQIHDRGRLPILVGGTGQYVWGLLEGWQVPQVKPDPSFRQALNDRAIDEGMESLYLELLRVDPQRASQVDPRNVQRVIRALEIHRSLGKAPLAAQTRASPSYDTLILGLTMERGQLRSRVDARIEDMIRSGWVEEVRYLLTQGYSPHLSSMSSLGYREICNYLMGNLSLEEAIQRTKNGTHRFVRRQYTWFRLQDPRINWIEAGSQDDIPYILVREFLNNPRTSRMTPSLSTST
ncbi:MAG: tRNA (adenosine(37)-N6)-dimethylallyltransferase MiaA, partial [Chloroflexi bacterium]|nr:tRNA (adenosine(37)-N6)-dimethylallyltransferase MiaA [Chloroflexota bacterium]